MPFQLHEEEKKAREFHAKPILKEDVVKIPVAKPAAPTKIEPFKLQIEERVGDQVGREYEEGTGGTEEGSSVQSQRAQSKLFTVDNF